MRNPSSAGASVEEEGLDRFVYSDECRMNYEWFFGIFNDFRKKLRNFV